MADETFEIPCSIIRGGTSRAVFFRSEDILKYERPATERLLLNIFGSPDAKQTNGLGGATSQTSKAAIIGPPSRPDADVDYTFAQVSVAAPVVDWGGNCGNISAAVGPYAINAGMVAVDGDEATVRIHNTNTGKIIVATVPLVGTRAATLGDHSIDGVPGTGPRIELAFEDPTSSYGRGVLPTGNPTDVVRLADGREFTVSVVDAANPTVFLDAAAVGLSGIELPETLERNTDATSILEEARAVIAAKIGLVSDPVDALRLSPGLPKVGVVCRPADYRTTTGATVEARDIELVGRLMSMQHPHRAYMMTGGIATAVAALIPGTLVHAVARPATVEAGRRIVRIGHPSGIVEFQVKLDDGGAAGMPGIDAVLLTRTARAIMDGVVHVPTALLGDTALAEFSTAGSA
jgi:2-methylaconitate cis-trans-isomerase PrpF